MTNTSSILSSTIKMSQYLDSSTRRAIILMTALPPTRGHILLVEFAREFMQNVSLFDYHIDVIVNSRSFEPLDGTTRAAAILAEFIGNHRIDLYVSEDDHAPQEPADSENFWDYWRASIMTTTGHLEYDYVFASEDYGLKLAEVIGADFIPFDTTRTISSISGTASRRFPLQSFRHLAPAIQKKYRKTVTFFGQESVGKTTMMKNALTSSFFTSTDVDVTRVPEWTRTYLELVGPEVTDEKMTTIVYGQYASQLTARTIPNAPFILQDTDLLSTIGYYLHWKGTYPMELEAHFTVTKSDLYVVMNDKIPFEPDQLRYDGGKRETTMDFWIELLKKFECNYHVVDAVHPLAQRREVNDRLMNLFYDDYNIGKFKREHEDHSH